MTAARWPRSAGRIALALALGAAGGAVFLTLGLPLPWMLGALVATMTASLLGAPIAAPERARPAVVAVIGVMLGSSFTPDLLEQAAGWALSLGFLLAYLVLAAAVVVPFYRRVGGFDPVTAYFAGMPGGLNEMAILGREMGGDDRRIILAHAARVVITIFLVAFWFRFVGGLEVGIALPSGGGLAGFAAADLAVLGLSAVAGVALGVRLRLPAPQLVGPLILSAAVHVTGLTHRAPPTELVVLAQVFLGTIMGCRFLGTPARDVVRALALSLVATAAILVLTLAFALAFHGWFGQATPQVILAYAPGGLTEMSLIALAMGDEVAYVATHHIARILLMIALAPLVIRWIGPRILGAAPHR